MRRCPEPPPFALPYPVIPVYREPNLMALQADASKLISKLQALDLEGLIADFRAAAAGVARASGRIDDAGRGIPRTLESMDRALAAIRDAARSLEKEIPNVAGDARGAMQRLAAALDQMDGTLREVKLSLSPGAPVPVQLEQTLREVGQAARSLRVLADSLERDPSQNRPRSTGGQAMTHRILAVALLAVVTGCLSPRTETSRYYTLPDASPPPTAAAPVASVGLGPVTFPPYLLRPELATRLGPERIAYAASDRWAGPLDELVLRALSEELRAGLPARAVTRWPWPLGAPPEVAVAVDLLAFEADAAGGASLDGPLDGDAPRHGAGRRRDPRREDGKAGDVAGSVSALGRALGVLARDVSAAARAPASR